MYRLFVQPPTTPANTTTSRFNKAVADALLQQEYAINYYSAAATYINSDNFLVGLLLELSNYMQYNTAIYRTVLNDLPRLCQNYGISSIYTPGTSKHNCIYSTECIFINICHPNNISPLLLLYHPHMDTSASIAPFTPTDIALNGVTVIGVDLPLLAKELHSWYMRPINRDSPSIGEFITKYLIPSMLPRQMDIALINRLPAIVHGRILAKEDSSSLKRRNMIDLSSSIYEPMLNTIEGAKTDRMSLINTLSSIPLYSGKTYYDMMPTNIGELNPNTYWVLFTVFTQLIYPATDSLNIELNVQNKTLLNRAVLYLYSTKSIDNMSELTKHIVMETKFPHIKMKL